VQNQDGESDVGERLFESFVCAHQFRDGLRGLRFIGNQRIRIHGLDNLGIAREILVLQMQNVGVRK
jgi:hypothetical protein